MVEVSDTDIDINDLEHLLEDSDENEFENSLTTTTVKVSEQSFDYEL